MGFCRTNNSIEGYHSKWNGLFSEKSAPKLIKFLHVLIGESEEWERIIQQYNYSPSLGIRGVTGLGRKETYVSQDADLKHHYEKQLQSGHTDRNNYLRKMAHRLKS